MPEFEIKVEDGMPELHDPAGPEIQTHEVGDELIITFSPGWTEKTGWQVGDTLVWSLNERDGMAVVVNKSAELRRKVNELLAAGPEL